MRFSRLSIWLCVLATWLACGQQAKQVPLFVELSPGDTGLDFVNEVENLDSFNIITYRNFYNGGGVAIGDIDNDSLPDVFFTANLGVNRLYRNLGNLRFEEITTQAGVAGEQSWSTGCSMADVNGDGWLDIYVCNSGDIKGDARKNELFINQGDGTFIERAALWELDDDGYSTHAAFFDYDLDGDLDCYLLNNSFKDPSRIDFRNIRHIRDSDGGDKLFENLGDRFVDVSEVRGIYGSSIGFGLGVTIADVNGDHWPDIYVSNDFWERDYLYVNHGGTFSEELTDRISLTSTASMGSAIADLDNDMDADIFTTDMLPSTNRRIKTMTVYNDYDLQDLKYRRDYHYQYTQNCLQLNLGTGIFDETAYLHGLAATDWSWGALIFDFQNDGWKDLFVSNGIFKDITDIDFSDFIENDEAVRKVVLDKGRFDFKDFLELLPSTPMPNFAFVNQGANFTEAANDIGLGRPQYSNGSVYADLDRDGDLDLVINNMNESAVIYRNETDRQTQNKWLRVRFEGTGMNPFGVGCRLDVFADSLQVSSENYMTIGFQSSTEPIATIGVGDRDQVDSLIIYWPSGKQTKQYGITTNQEITVQDTRNAAQMRMPLERRSTSEDSRLAPILRHQENLHNDFDHEVLAPHMVSTEGPELLHGDLNGDGQDDLVLLNGEGSPIQVALSMSEGLVNSVQPDLERDKNYEITAGLLFDLDRDGDLDLVAGVGGNDPEHDPEHYRVRTYVNDGKGVFSFTQVPGFEALGNVSVIEAIEFDQGVHGLFIGCRIVPGNYGLVPRNYLLATRDFSQWRDITQKSLGVLGMVTDATKGDFDGDGDGDLAVVGEWMPVHIFENVGNGLALEQTLPESSGLWQSIEAADLNNDGLTDLVAGNWGLNSKWRASAQRPLQLHVADFDQNGKSECILEWFAPGDEYSSLFPTKRDLTEQLPHLKKQILLNAQYAQSSVNDLLSEDIERRTWKVNELRSIVFMQSSDSLFIKHPLPLAAQKTVVYAIHVEDIDQNGSLDLILGGNLFGLKPEMGRMEAMGSIVLTQQDGVFQQNEELAAKLYMRGQIRDLVKVKIAGHNRLLVARNDDTLLAHNLPASDE